MINDFKDNPSTSFHDDESDADDATRLMGGLELRKRTFWSIHPSVILLVAGTLWLMGTMVLFSTRYLRPLSDIPSKCVNPQVAYSPAQDAVKYEKVWFTDGVNNRTKYMGSSIEVDEAWREEYAFGLVRITKEEAAQLPAQTSQIPGDTDHYIVGLEVFHQLHCLNGMRKALDPKHYNLTMEEMAPDDRRKQRAHLDHCIELLRQAVMCHSDISLNVFTWVSSKQKTLPHSESTHSCRNFEGIKQWALERQLLNGLDEDQHLEVSPPNDYTFNGYT